MKQEKEQEMNEKSKYVTYYIYQVKSFVFYRK